MPIIKQNSSFVEDSDILCNINIHFYYKWQRIWQLSKIKKRKKEANVEIAPDWSLLTKRKLKFTV